MCRAQYLITIEFSIGCICFTYFYPFKNRISLKLFELFKRISKRKSVLSIFHCFFAREPVNKSHCVNRQFHPFFLKYYFVLIFVYVKNYYHSFLFAHFSRKLVIAKGKMFENFFFFPLSRNLFTYFLHYCCSIQRNDLFFVESFPLVRSLSSVDNSANQNQYKY